MKKYLFAVLAGAALILSGCSIPSTASDEIYVHKGGGPFEDQSAKGCIEPSNRQVESAFDGYFAYPASQRVYAFTGDKNTDDHTPFTVVSKDGQTLTVPGTLSFQLNIDCKVLQKFHDKIGNRYQAYMEDGHDSPGWSKMLNIYFAPSVDATLDRIAKQYTWRELYSDVTIKDKMNTAMNTEVARLINQQFIGEDQYFLDFSALIQQPQAAKELVDAVKQEETSRAQAAAMKGHNCRCRVGNDVVLGSAARDGTGNDQ